MTPVGIDLILVTASVAITAYLLADVACRWIARKWMAQRPGGTR